VGGRGCDRSVEDGLRRRGVGDLGRRGRGWRVENGCGLGNGRGRDRLALGLLRLDCGFGLFDDGLASEALGVRETTHAIRGRIVDARRVALDADLQALGEVEDHLVLDTELSRQLVDPNLLGGQARCLLPTSFVVRCCRCCG
jgi:hypothetical protein